MRRHGRGAGWMLLALVAVVTGVGAQEAPAPAKALNEETQKAVDEILSTVDKYQENREPLDAARLTNLIVAVTPHSAEMDQQSRQNLVDELGEVLVLDGKGMLRLKEEKAVKWDSLGSLRTSILDLFLTAKEDDTARGYLTDYYRRHGQEAIKDPTSFAALVGRAIEKLGGELPWMEDQPKPKYTEEELKEMSVQTRDIITRLGRKTRDYDRLPMIQMLGMLGRPEAEETLAKFAQSIEVHWIVRHDALTALGEVGGEKARAVLTAELTRPMKENADLDDGDSLDAEFRVCAALALGHCGDQATYTFLTRLSQDEKQYKRVRAAAQKASAKLREQLLNKTDH